MASPFPGMDPYLEEPSMWRGVHHRLISTIADTLGDALAPAFYVNVEERVYIATPDDLITLPEIRPHVYIVRNADRQPYATDVAVITPPLLVQPLEAEEVHEPFLEIRDVRTREVVTVIEVVSPSNKAAGTTGQRQLLHKRQQVMDSSTHWIEIDLLRFGERPPEARNRGDYYSLLHRGVFGAPYEIWAWDLRSALPVIGVPTRDSLPVTPLNLQTIITTVYRRGHYDLVLDYDRPPPRPRLSVDDAAWCVEQVAAWRASSI